MHINKNWLLILASTLSLIVNGELRAHDDIRASDEPEASKAAPAVTAADWSTYNHDVRGWRYNSAEKILTPSAAPKLVEKWRFPRRGSELRVGVIHTTPTVVNGYSYFGTTTFPAMYKVRPNGDLAWVFRTEASALEGSLIPPSNREGPNSISTNRGILSSALVTQKAVFFGDTAGVFYALKRADGQLIWKVNTKLPGFPGHHPINTFMSSPIFADGKVIVGGGGYEHPYPLSPDYACCTGRGFVVAFDPDSGRALWKYDVGEPPKELVPPVVIQDAKGKHVYKFGPSTSSVWSAPSFDKESGLIFFGTDVHNSPRQPTESDPRLDTKYSSAVIALDVKDGTERWVSQINEGDIYNHTMSGYDPNTKRYKDCSIGDTPKLYNALIDEKDTKVVGVGCKNGGFYVFRADNGKLVGNTPIFEGEPKYPLAPRRNARTIALPSPIGGIQTGCAFDGKNVVTNGTDFLLLATRSPGPPEGGRVVSISPDASTERWRHERPQIKTPTFKGGDPVASGIALNAGGIACFTTTISEKLVVLDRSNGKQIKEFDIGTVWSGPSISRGRIFVGTGSVLFFKKKYQGELISFGLPGEDELDRMGTGKE